MNETELNKRELIYESEESLIYREDREGEPSIVIKVLRADSPDPSQILNFNNEFEFTHDLDINGLRKALFKRKESDKYVLGLEFVDGLSLNEDLSSRDYSMEDFLGTFISIADTLGKLHEKGIIHKDINGSNILIENDARTPILIDFGISTKLDLKSSNMGNPDRIRGTLSYMSPEQTGRVNRKVDSRSDLYSLGVTMFQVLTGQLPFESDNSLELVHFHIAKNIPLAHQIRKDVPEVLSHIIAKLMAKNAEDRYQSAFGLKADLQKCLSFLESRDVMNAFKLGEKDYSGKFEIPQKLFGRNEEVDSLLKSFNRVSKGGMELFLVKGYSGVGKTSVIGEIYKPITEKRGYFCSGKFDQYHKNTPYYAIFQALSEFCDLLLTENAETLQKWKELILKALGENGQVLIEYLPKLENIIGRQKPVPKLDVKETQNRFNVVFTNFIRAISKREHPFVLFCDDLQWADVVSLSLIKMLVTDPNNKYFMVIGAYRDNEVSSGHPLTQMLIELKKDSAPLHEIKLKSLQKKHLFEIVSESFDLDKNQAQDLTDIVYSKTLGNAFFSIEFLKTLYTEGFVKYNFEKNKWNVSFDLIRKKGITNNVVDLLVSRISGLPENTQKSLRIAACVGSIFELKLLATISDEKQGETIANLWPAVKEGFINPLGDNYEYLHIEDDIGEVEVFFQFVHDRIQQAAYSLIEPTELKQIHLKTAREFNGRLKDNPELLFDVVDHYNEVLKHINEEESEFLPELNLSAAIRSRDSGDYNSAQHYISMSKAVGTDNLWKEKYDFALRLYKSAGEIAYLNGDSEKSREILNKCLENTTNPDDTSDIYFLLAQNLGNQALYQEAINSARDGLKQLDFEFPEKDEAEARIGEEMGKILAYFKENGIEGIADKPVMESRRLLATMNLLDNLSINTYVAGEPNLWTVHVLFKINMTLENGLSCEGGYAFTELAIIFNIMNNNSLAYPSSLVGLKIVEMFKDESPRHYSRAGHLHINYSLSWNEHIRETIKLNPAYYQISLDCGELVFAGYMSMYSILNLLFWGKDKLGDLINMVPDALNFTHRIQHVLSSGSIEAMNLVMHNLSGLTEDVLSFDTENLKEIDFINEHKKGQNIYAITILHLYKAQALYHHKQYREALVALKVTEEHFSVIIGNPCQDSTYRTVYTLTLIALLDQKPKSKEKYLPIIESNLEQLKTWADQNPDNFGHKYYLAAAELSRVNGNELEAINQYALALKSAEENEFEREQALINEKAGEYWISVNQEMYAKVHLEKARYIYRKLGYQRSAERIGSAYAYLFTSKTRASKTLSRTTQLTTTISSTTTLEELDLLSIVKATQTLSEEIVMDSLLKKLLDIVIENAGGERAVLLLSNGGGNWHVEADHNIEESENHHERKKSLEDSKNLPHTVINYTIRTKSDVSSADDTLERIFIKDDYLLGEEIHSFLCMPLLHKGALIGVIYVEHRTQNAFTEDQREVLRLLSSQMAVSIENANLYDLQTRLNKAYQRFVPHDFIHALGREGILDVRLGDHISQDMTVMFCDIRSYTALAEKMTTEENFQFINAYLNRIGPIISQNNGFINHYFGDGFIALFKERPEDAIQAAIEINKALDKYNSERKNIGDQPIKVGFGLHKGPIMMGIIGDAERHDANVLSDAVNTSSRLEGMTKIFGVNVILSQHTVEGIEDTDRYKFRALGKVQLLGKGDITPIFEMFDADPANIHDLKLKTLEAFNKGMKHYFEKDFTACAVALNGVLQVNPDDKTARRYLQNAAKYMVEGVSEDWTGVEKMEGK